MADDENIELTEELEKLRADLAMLGEQIPKTKSETKAEAVEAAKELLEQKLAEKDAQEKAQKEKEEAEQMEQEAEKKRLAEEAEAQRIAEEEQAKQAKEDAKTKEKELREQIRKEIEEEERRKGIIGDILEYSGIDKDDKDYERFEKSFNDMETVQLELSLRGAVAAAESREIKPKTTEGGEGKDAVYTALPRSQLHVPDPTKLDMDTQNFIWKTYLERKFGVIGLDPMWFERELPEINPKTYKMMKEIEKRRTRRG